MPVYVHIYKYEYMNNLSSVPGPQSAQSVAVSGSCLALAVTKSWSLPVGYDS